MRNLPSNSLFPDSDKDTKIIAFLRAVPSLDFSCKGIENISRRFNVSIEHIIGLIARLKGGKSNV